MSHFIYNIVMRKRVKLNSYEPLVRDKNMKFVTRSWYNKIFPFVKPFEFLKRNKIFQCKENNSADVIRFRDHVPHKVLNRNLKFNYFSPHQHHAYYAEHV